MAKSDSRATVQKTGGRVTAIGETVRATVGGAGNTAKPPPMGATGVKRVTQSRKTN